MAKSAPLVLTKLKKDFGSVHAVQNVNLTVQAGEVWGIVGPNGAGKTTTIKLILGLLEPDSGSITLFGNQGIKSNTKARVGYMPESPAFYKHLTGRELLYFAGSLFGIRGQELKKRVDTLLQEVDLVKAANRPLSGYSKGMLQRICLAQALINQPELVFLDEPLDGLDPLGRIQMREILHDIRGSGTAVVFNSHILSDVEAVATHIAIMDHGKLVTSGTVRQVVPKGQTLEQVFLRSVKGGQA